MKDINSLRVGNRVRVTGAIDDPEPLMIGDEGIVTGINVNHLGTQIQVRWNSGRALMLLDHDPFQVINDG